MADAPRIPEEIQFPTRNPRQRAGIESDNLFPSAPDDEWWTLHDLNPCTEESARDRKRRAEAARKQYEEERRVLRGLRESARHTKDLETTMRRNIPALSELLGGAHVKMTFYDLRRKEHPFSIGGDRPGWAASTIKVPVMIAVARAYDEGRLSPDEIFIIDHKYTLEAGDPVSCAKEGTAITADKLVKLMIGVSDNEATNMLADRVGIPYVNDTARQLGARRTMLGHLLAPRVPRYTTWWNPDGSNLTTTDDMAMLLKAIYTDTAASAAECGRMRETLEGRFDGRTRPAMSYLGSRLPVGTRFGAKIGYISDDDCGDDVHDVGVVGGDYIISVMCNRIGSAKIQEANAAEAEQHGKNPRSIAKSIYSRLFASGDPPVFYTSRAPSVIAAISRAVYDAYHKDDTTHDADIGGMKAPAV